MGMKVRHLAVCSGMLALALASAASPGAGAAPPERSDRLPTTPSEVVTQQRQWPLPMRSGTGRRIVYSQKLMHVWLVNAQEVVVAHYPVTGRADHPPAGRYRVFSKSSYTISWDRRFYMKWMTRWYRGVNANVGFHSIPKTWSGVPIQSLADLGKPLGVGGCVRLGYSAAKFLYDWARVGTPVYVLR